MRIVRFNDNRIGILDDDRILDVSAVKQAIPQVQWPYPPGDLFVAELSILMPEMRRLAADAPSIEAASAKLLSPIANPSKVIAAPVNYKLHLQEARDDTEINYGMPIKTIDELGVFLKSVTSIVGPSEGVVQHWPDRRIDHEIELAVVIGKPGFAIGRDQAMDHVAGYTIGLDMTVRGTEDRSYRKSLDSFTVLGPSLVTADEVSDPGRLDFWIDVGGERRQRSNTNLLIFDIPRLIEYASSAYRLYPGDVLLTGTPEGVGPVTAGDVMTCHIDQVGDMQVHIAAASHATNI